MGSRSDGHRLTRLHSDVHLFPFFKSLILYAHIPTSQGLMPSLTLTVFECCLKTPFPYPSPQNIQASESMLKNLAVTCAVNVAFSLLAKNIDNWWVRGRRGPRWAPPPIFKMVQPEEFN